MAIIEQDFLALTSDLDTAAFWAENDPCWMPTTSKPRCALEFSPDDHWLFEFLGVQSTVRYYQDKDYRDQLHRAANEITRQYVGKTFFDEDSWQHQPHRIENLFDCVFSNTEGATPWLTPATDDPDEFARILAKAEARDMEKWTFPEPFLQEWETRKSRGDAMPRLGTGSRGPATIMTSVLHPETVFFWMYDYPDLMHRFRDILAQKMVELNQALRTFSNNRQPGWWITDDNSALFNRKLYNEFCVPVLEKVLNTFAPGDAERYQHSDSAMGHHLDAQRELGINMVNYGPEVDVALIREKMPDAIIKGHIPPFLLRNESPDVIRAKVASDFQIAGYDGRLVIATAGSLAAGTGVGRMRWLMQVTQEECRYDLQV
ncbi:MAG: uroporphyrinogen decarboxylase family protein [Anaerolineae bacterium]|nr:uroporphyrinogen decarboxylase family protein [Anaerolineae bacterium]